MFLEPSSGEDPKGSHMKPTVILIFAVILFTISCAPEPASDWVVPMEAPLYSHPVLMDEILYFGSNDHSFYALETRTQEIVWSYATSGLIQTQALVTPEAVYFSNASHIYALDRATGAERWKVTHTPDASHQPLDPWDYHHGTPVQVGTAIYFGMANGNLYGLDMETGNQVDQFTTEGSAVIRCTPTVHKGVIYFGDWNGRVYAYDTVQQDTLWSFATYEEQPYPTFGQLNAGFAVQDSLLIFGGRNPELQILNIQTGAVVWNYVSEDGGWISGDPLVVDGILYIAGSDNHRFFAFDVYTGQALWTFDFLYNNFGLPLLVEDQLIFTTGDAGSAYRGDDGRGYLYALNRHHGELQNFRSFEANVFSTPVMDEHSIFVLGVDGQVHAVDKQEMLTPAEDLQQRGYYSIEKTEPGIQAFQDSVQLVFKVMAQANLELTISDLTGIPLRQWPLRVSAPGEQSWWWNGQDETGNVVSPGYYHFELRSGEYFVNGYLQKEE